MKDAAENGRRLEEITLTIYRKYSYFFICEKWQHFQMLNLSDIARNEENERAGKKSRWILAKWMRKRNITHWYWKNAVAACKMHKKIHGKLRINEWI